MIQRPFSLNAAVLSFRQLPRPERWGGIRCSHSESLRRVRCVRPVAAPSQYQIIDLGTLPGWSANSQYTAWAINENNVVVGFVTGELNGVQTTHAWVWTPCGEFGLPARTMVDLTALVLPSGCTSGCDGLAWDINNAGIVVGEQSGVGATDPSAFIWNLATSQSFPRVNPTGGTASAQGINDNSPAVVTGYRFDGVLTTCGASPDSFFWNYSSTATTLTSMPNGGSGISTGYDIGDDSVNPTDLSLLLGAWGACSPCASCVGDLDGDCAVGAADLSLLLGAWGACPNVWCSGNTFVANSEADAITNPGAPIALDAPLSLALNFFGFDSIESFAAWAQGAEPAEAAAVAAGLSAIAGAGS